MIHAQEPTSNSRGNEKDHNPQCRSCRKTTVHCASRARRIHEENLILMFFCGSSLSWWFTVLCQHIHLTFYSSTAFLVFNCFFSCIGGYHLLWSTNEQAAYLCTFTASDWTPKLWWTSFVNRKTVWEREKTALRSTRRIKCHSRW